MTRLEALKELACKIEAGEGVKTGYYGVLVVAQFTSIGVSAQFLVQDAFHGSLDAAQALHEALLPGWHFDIDSEAGGVCVFKSALDSAELGKCECLARAWLLAILKALIAQEEALQDLADADRDLI